MKLRPSRNILSNYRRALPALSIMMIISTVLVGGLLAQGPQNQGGMMMQQQAPARVMPNWELSERWSPAKIGKLLFDVSVTPHWFEQSDRFWYSYETTDGTRYWIMDPVKKAKTPLFDNAKVAMQLTLLTGLPYDAQHLAIRNLKLVKNDTTLTFDVVVSKDAVIPNEEKKEEKKEDKVIDDTNQEENQTQVQQGGRGGRGRGGAQQPAARQLLPKIRAQFIFRWISPAEKLRGSINLTRPQRARAGLLQFRPTAKRLSSPADTIFS